MLPSHSSSSAAGVADNVVIIGACDGRHVRFRKRVGHGSVTVGAGRARPHPQGDGVLRPEADRLPARRAAARGERARVRWRPAAHHRARAAARPAAVLPDLLAALRRGLQHAGGLRLSTRRAAARGAAASPARARSARCPAPAVAGGRGAAALRDRRDAVPPPADLPPGAGAHRGRRDRGSGAHRPAAHAAATGARGGPRTARSDGAHERCLRNPRDRGGRPDLLRAAAARAGRCRARARRRRDGRSRPPLAP